MYLDNIFRKERISSDYAISGIDVYEVLIESTEDISQLRSEIIASEAGLVLSSESVSLASEGVGEKLKAFAKKVWEFIKNIAKKVANFFRSLASKIRDAIKKLIGKSKAAEAEAKKEDAAKGSSKTYYRDHEDDDDTVIYALAAGSVTEELKEMANIINIETLINDIKSFENKDIEAIKEAMDKREEEVVNSMDSTFTEFGEDMKSISRTTVASYFVKVSTKLQANMVHKQSAYSLENAAKLLENMANSIMQTFEKAANIVKSKDSEDVNISGDEAVIQRQKKNHFIIDRIREVIKMASEVSVHLASSMYKVITVCLIIINSKINGIMEDDVERCIDNIMSAYQTAGESLIRLGSKK